MTYLGYAQKITEELVGGLISGYYQQLAMPHWTELLQGKTLALMV